MKHTIEKEKTMVADMIKIYCHGNHKTKKGELCPSCAALQDYALERLSKCPHKDCKTFCSMCKTHCYKPTMREEIKKVMRYSGPRILPTHPIAGTSHFIDTVKGIREKKRAEKNSAA